MAHPTLTTTTTKTTISTLKTPSRFLFIASIGNPRPYLKTRHSAGHILLDALTPLLPGRFPLVSGNPHVATGPVFHTTWHSSSYMNESGPKLVRQLSKWMGATQTDVLERVVRSGQIAVMESGADWDAEQHAHAPPHAGQKKPGQKQRQNQEPEWYHRGIDPSTLTRVHPTLVILHDELEAPLGKVKVRRGGPETASLRGHRGLISVMESLRGKGLYPPRRAGNNNNGVAGDLAVLRVGVGIGRPDTRNRGDVANFVLTEMDAAEMKAVKAAARPVLDILADEMYRGE